MPIIKWGNLEVRNAFYTVRKFRSKNSSLNTEMIYQWFRSTKCILYCDKI